MRPTMGLPCCVRPAPELTSSEAMGGPGEPIRTGLITLGAALWLLRGGGCPCKARALKRKVRNYVESFAESDHKRDPRRHRIYVTEGAILNEKHREAYLSERPD